MSSKNFQNVILFKRKDDGSSGDRYEHQLKKHDLIPHFVTTLSFEFCNLEKLAVHLKNSKDFSGIIFTSQRSIEAVHECLEAFQKDVRNTLLLAWKNYKTFVVGLSTGEMCRKLFGFNDVVGEECGNAAALTAVIENHVKIGAKPLLFPCGDQKLSTIMKILPVSGININEITIYKTTSHPDLEYEINRISKLIDFNSSFLSFFSPSGVRYVSDILEKKGLDKASIYCAAIGPTTAEAIKTLGLNLYCTASKPNAECLSMVIADASQ